MCKLKDLRKHQKNFSRGESYPGGCQALLIVLVSISNERMNIQAIKRDRLVRYIMWLDLRNTVLYTKEYITMNPFT